VALSLGRAIALGTAALIVIAAVVFAAGRWVGHVAASERVAALETQVSDLQEENADLALVGERIERLEAEYRQLREVMGGDLGSSGRDILLPPLSEDDVRRSGVAANQDETRFVWPVVERGFVTRMFGDTSSAPLGEHAGVDIAVPVGSYVRCARGGVVLETGDDPEYGLYVRVGHDQGLGSLYAHNSWLFVAQGDSVEMGQVIALSGNSGRSTAPHLHVEMERDGQPVDPLEYLAEGT
jgi:murein DD-endopeptidase MepM/ murein hydrolase activator NlpD